MDWNFKNDFEYDWCMTALNSAKADLQKVKNSRWLIFGRKADSFLEAVVRFLRFADLQLNLGLDLHLLIGAEDCDTAVSAFPFATVGNIDRTDGPVAADYCLCFGYTQAAGSSVSPADLEQMTKFWQQIARPHRRGIYISGFRVYNRYAYPSVAAEGEFQQETTDPGRNLARAAERLVTQIPGSHIILRPGIILGAGLDMRSPVTDLLDRLIRREPVGDLSVRPCYSMVYITDFLTALLRATVTEQANTAYNVSSPDGTDSLLRICELYMSLDATAPQISLTLQHTANCRNFALNGAKLTGLGWKPLVDLRTIAAMEIAARRGTTNGMCFVDGYYGKLQTIQSLLLQILQEVDRICKKYNIPYFLAGGTLLGAIRHQGFIPWDDDLDVMMRRSDYDRFLAAAEKELPGHLSLRSSSTEEGNHYLISKIRMSGTVFSSEYLMNFPKLHNGIFVDIIAQDYTANSSLGQKLHLKLSLLARGLVFKKWSGGSAAAARGKSYAIFDLVKRLFSIRALERFQHWVLTLFNKLPGRKYLYDSMGINIAKGVYPAAWLSESVNVTFCGQEFPAPVEYDKYLRYLYGEYMQPVPVTQRRCVHAVPWVDLGAYAEDPLQDSAVNSKEATYV